MERQKSSSSILIIIVYAALRCLLLFCTVLCTIKSAQALNIMPTSSSGKAPRVELFFSSSDELRKRITFLKSKGVSSFNIVNKSNKDDILQSVRAIQQEFQKDAENDTKLSICAHYSMKYNKSRKMDGAFQLLKDYVENMNELDNPTDNEILLITGSGPKGKLCSLTALQRLQKETSTKISPSIAVAFNPFFPNKKDYEDEKLRLEEKLATGMVSKVYIEYTVWSRFGTLAVCSANVDYASNNIVNFQTI